MMDNCFQKEVHLYIQLIRTKSLRPIIIQPINLLNVWEEKEKTKIMNMKKIYSIPMPLMMIAILTMKIYPDPKLMSRIAKKSQKNTMLMRLMKIMFSTNNVFSVVKYFFICSMLVKLIFLYFYIKQQTVAFYSVNIFYVSKKNFFFLGSKIILRRKCY